MAPDPYQPHLDRAAALFEAGDVVQAGQIWQAILKREPRHQAALAGLYRVKEALDRKRGWDNERLVQEGCTLYDLGQEAEALQKWEQVLASDPAHKLARAYAENARRELGRPEPEAPAAPEPEEPGAPGADPDRLVREGAQLYDLGMAEEAAVKWRRALELRPEHQDAAEYLKMARRDQEEAAKAPPARPAPARPAADQREARIARAEQHLRDGHLDDAAMAFRQLLDQGVQETRVLHGYQQARALLTAQAEAVRIVPVAPAPAPEPRPEPAPEPRPVPAQPTAPPRALTVRPPQRDGFRLPGPLRGLRLPRRLDRPRVLAAAAGAAVLVLLALVLYGLHRREAALKEAVAAARKAALRPVSRMVEVPSLEQPTEAVRAEAEQALGADPLLAYLRGQEWARRDPDNSAAILLVQKAKDKLTYGPATATLADYDKAVQAGDLESACRAALSLLRRDPDDLDLRGRARKVLLALAPLYAADDRMGKARDMLLLGRALYPRDLAWAARLKLLESIQEMAKPDRIPWIQLLG
jgi:tetratricopeptide (TPR) repeat protein